MRESADPANGHPTPQPVKGARRASESRRHSTTVPSVTSYDEETDYAPFAAEGFYPQSAPKASSGPRGSGAPSRSFSARAAANLNYTTRKPAPVAPPGLNEESTTPRGLPPAEYLQGTNAAISGSEETQPAPEVPAAPSLPSPPTRSNTMRSTSGTSTKRDWASDRSPLQKLEVTLNGISKEEKRARVQEAEMRLRERLARQKIEKEKAEAAAAAAVSTASAPRPNSKQSAYSEDRGTPASTRRSRQREELARAAPPVARPPGGTAVRHNRAVSMNAQYPAIRQPEDAHYAGAENVKPSPVKMGSVPEDQLQSANTAQGKDRSRDLYTLAQYLSKGLRRRCSLLLLSLARRESRPLLRRSLYLVRRCRGQNHDKQCRSMYHHRRLRPFLNGEMLLLLDLEPPTLTSNIWILIEAKHGGKVAPQPIAGRAGPSPRTIKLRPRKSQVRDTNLSLERAKLGRKRSNFL